MAAKGKSVPDVIAQNLKVLFCGINPGLYTAAVGHHFARPGNRFWPALHAAGFTDGLFSPFEERKLLSRGYGITNLVNRATASASELSAQDLERGATNIVRRVKRYRPVILALLGLQAYRVGFRRRDASIGKQEERIGETIIWVLPNPSGLNAHFQAKDFAKLFGLVRDAAEAEKRSQKLS